MVPYDVRKYNLITKLCQLYQRLEETGFTFQITQTYPNIAMFPSIVIQKWFYCTCYSYITLGNKKLTENVLLETTVTAKVIIAITLNFVITNAWMDEEGFDFGRNGPVDWVILECLSESYFDWKGERIRIP